MTTCTKSHFAKLIKRVPSYVTQLISEGRIVLTADGKQVEVEASLAKLEQTASGANPAVAQRHEQARNGETDKALSLQDGSRAKFKSMVLHYENQIIKIEMMLRRGLRFEMTEVRKEAKAIGNVMRASVERLIDQTAPRLAVIKNKEERKLLLQSEIKKLNQIIKAEFIRSLRRLKKGAK